MTKPYHLGAMEPATPVRANALSAVAGRDIIEAESLYGLQNITRISAAQRVQHYRHVGALYPMPLTRRVNPL